MTRPVTRGGPDEAVDVSGPAPVTPDVRSPRQPAKAKSARTPRLQAVESRSGGVSGQAAANAELRSDGKTADLAAAVARLQSELTEVRLRQDGLAEELERLKAQAGPRAQAVRVLQEAVEEVAARLQEKDARAELQSLQARESLRALRHRLDRVEGRAPPRPPDHAEDSEPTQLAERVGRIESAPGPTPDLAALEAATARLVTLVEEGQRQTTTCLRRLDASLVGLERFVGGGAALPVRDGAEAGPPREAPDGLRADLAEPAVQLSDPTLDHIEAALRDLSDQVAATDHRSAAAISRMGHEVIRLAQSLDGRVEDVERRSDARAAEMGGEMARLAHTVEDRLTRADDARTEALDRLGGRIASLARQLADRISAAERRTAEEVTVGLDAASAQLQRAAVKLNDAYERTASELGERIRESEARAARLVAETREQAAAAQARDVETAPSPDRRPGRDAPQPPAFPFGALNAGEPARGPFPAATPAVTPFTQRVDAPPAAESRPGQPPAPGSDAPVKVASGHRELIEQARAAARLNAERTRRLSESGADPFAEDPPVKSQPTSGEPLTLRSGFGRLTRRGRGVFGG